jgi:beta-lactamase regulating signal transducer with metallopeptidase domain
MILLLASALDVAIVIAVALAITAFMRRRSASLRHGILAAALVAAAVVPAIESLGPRWELPVGWRAAADTTSTLRLTSSPAPEASTTAIPEVAAAPALSWIDGIMLLWIAGMLVTGAGLLTGLVRLARVSRRCTLIESGPWRLLANEMSARYRLHRPVDLLQSAHASLLLTWGLFRPKILLPGGADDWSDERREAVLAHELAHIRRGDWALQLAAEALRAVYWFNPLVWLACRRLRHESEYACDDAVLDTGVEATEYATHLLGVARHAIGHGNAWASAPAIAHPSTLERRISAMLNHQRNRAPLTGRTWAIAVAGAIVVTVPLAAITITERAAAPVVQATRGGDVALVTPDAPAPAADPTPARLPAPAPRSSSARAAVAPAEQLDPATMSGTMQDPSGAVLPGVEVTLTDTQFGVRYSRVTDATGSFTFPELQPGRYELDARLPGFATVANVMTIAAGTNVRRTITLPIGSLEETIHVVCSGGPAASIAVPLAPVQGRGAAPGGPGAGRPVRVGGQIKAPSQIAKVNPVCPRGILPDRDTVINLVGRIGVDGFMNEVRHVRDDRDPAPPAEFIESALEAVRQWKYTPTLLNGQPVDVNVRVTVLYARNTRRA